jgi:hypothetical protein
VQPMQKPYRRARRRERISQGAALGLSYAAEATQVT